MPLNTIEAIKTRYSCRAFSDKLPSNSDLQLIAEAAIAAPSAMNQQPWRVIVLKNKELLAELEAEGMKNIAALSDKGIYERIMSRGGKLYYNTPCQVIIAMPKSDNNWSGIDCGIITQNIALAAVSLNIDSLICGLISFSFAEEKSEYFKKELGFPEGYDIGISVLLGYAQNPGGTPHEQDLSKISFVE